MESPFDKVVGLLLKDILINKDIPPRQVFSCQYCEIYRTIFLKNTFCSIYFSKILSDDRILWTSLGIKLIFFIFLVPLVCFLHNSCVRIGSPSLFCACMYTKFLVSITFARFTMPQSETTSRIIASSPSNLL